MENLGRKRKDVALNKPNRLIKNNIHDYPLLEFFLSTSLRGRV